MYSYSTSSLPSGGINKGQVIVLKCSCPPCCSCNSKELRNWHHKECGHPLFISEYGDIFCKFFKDRSDCRGFFLQNALFQCSVSKSNNAWQQYKTYSQFAMSMAQAIQSADFSLNQQQMLKFITSLNQQATKRWAY